MNKQQFWFDDISILVNQDYLQDFIHVKEMNTSEKLNAIMRFCMYLSLILILITGNSNYIFIVICGAILTYIIHINKDEETIKNKNENPSLLGLVNEHFFPILVEKTLIPQQERIINKNYFLAGREIILEKYFHKF